MDENTVDNSLRQLLAIKEAGGNFAATFSLLSTKKHTYSCETVDGKEFSCRTKAHTLAIKDITSSTVTIDNPWDSSKEYIVSWSNFKAMHIARIEWASF